MFVHRLISAWESRWLKREMKTEKEQCLPDADRRVAAWLLIRIAAEAAEHRSILRNVPLYFCHDWA